MPKEIRLTIWIVLFVLVVVAFLFWILYPIFKKRATRKNPKASYYKKVMKITDYGDYLLVNDIKIHPQDPRSPSIDHILAGNKYFYLIYDYFFEGAVDASLNDDYWIYHKLDGTKIKIINPLRKSSQISEYFALSKSMDPSFIVTIILINNDCFITPIKNDDKRINLTPLSKLDKLINSYESENIGKFNPKDLERIVASFAEKKENAKNQQKEI